MVSALLFALLAVLVSSAWAASNVVDYTRDAAGNITAIRRMSAPGFAITGFSPMSGKEGAVVTIYGTGFSATPQDNIVKFNGTTASVFASAVGSISTAVPGGATTGRITVTVGANTATSAQDFTVIPPTSPTITSFTPTAGVAGTSVTITGTYFDTAPNGTTVKLNGVSGTVTVTSTTSLTFTVPGAAASGGITATTAEGTGASSADFIVPPAGVAAADIITAVRLAMGGAASSLVIGTASKHGLLLFDGAANGYYTLQFGSFSTSPSNAFVDYKVIRPDNTVLATGRVGNTYRPTIHLPRLPATGTYSVLISPGAATLNANVSAAVDPTLTIDGSAVAVTTTGANQTLRFAFDLTAGQRVGIGVSGTTFTPANATGMTFAANAQDGSAVSGSTMPTCYTATAGNTAANCDGELVATTAGTYTLIASPPNVQTSFSAQLSSDVAGTLAVDGGHDLTLTRVGQDGRDTFAATAGDSLAVTLSNIATTPQPHTVYLTVVKPDGTFLTSGSGTATVGAYVELGAVPTTGEYAVRVDPAYGAQGTMRVGLKQGVMLLPTSAPTAFATTSAGDAARFRFSGTAAQNLTIGVTGIAYGGSSGSSTSVYVYRPDRTQVGSVTTCIPTVASGTCKITLTNLPVTGTYSIAIVPPGGVTVSGNINISDDLTGTLLQGSPAVLDATRAGQAARFTFSGTTGESTMVKLHGVGITPAVGSVGLIVYRPDGAILGSTSATASAQAVLNLSSLPSTGTYKVLLQPTYGVTWQGTLALDAGTALTVDGSTASLATASAGEPLRYRFSASAGQRVEIGLAGLTYAVADSAPTAYTLYRPDGTSIASGSCATAGAGSCETAVASAPSTGTYALIFTPPPSSSITAGTLAVSTPATGTLTIGGVAQTVAIARTGQTARYTFSGTSGQLLRLNWTSVTVSSGATVAVTVLKPDGFSLSSSSFVNGASGGFDIASLPSTGTYTVVLDPSLAATTTADIALVTR